ncbi:hypothetical protein AAFF_G00318870 [Aldrovandia affinis]|uniref:Uncharacterized protein n=1 Tax=Aldrovandia affinis TaxID=143900 RepID=A0AAD7SMI1_9TELE|nr:hypothetical protein AAFF_G00318870 [Aldrovandia affinis]
MALNGCLSCVIQRDVTAVGGWNTEAESRPRENRETTPNNSLKISEGENSNGHEETHPLCLPYRLMAVQA